MSMTKRTRFEVLKRDNHTCRYCGRSAPDVKLHVDHVVPVALGGTDDPTNLVAACADCNAGKSSTPADAKTVADVAEDAHRWARLQQAAWSAKIEQADRIEDAADALAEELKGLFFGDGGTLWTDELETIHIFAERGVPPEILRYAAERATRRGYGSSERRDQWKYMCAIVWAQLKSVEATVRDHFDIEGCWYDANALDHERCDAFDEGRAGGLREGQLREFQRGGFGMFLLRSIVDGGAEPAIAAYNEFDHLGGL